MTIIKILLVFINIIIILSCAVHQISLKELEYQGGYKDASEFAKKDEMESMCLTDPRYNDQKAQEYKRLLKEEGKSEAYIKGFYAGYQKERFEFFDMLCIEYDH